MKITKAIAYAFPSSHTAKSLGFARTGCYFVQQTYSNIEGSDQCATFAPHDAEGFAEPNHPDLIALFHEYEGIPCPHFLMYGNDKALTALHLLNQPIPPVHHSVEAK